MKNMNRNIIYCLTTLLITAGLFSCSKEYSAETGAFTTAKGTLHDNTGSCYTSTVVGNYYTGIKLTDSNYLQVQVNVTTAGNYAVTTDTVNGFSFKDAGIFNATGVQTIKLKAAGVPVLNQNSAFFITFDSTICNVTVLVKDSTGNAGNGATAADSAWQFTEGSKYFHGPIDTAFIFDTTVASIPFKVVNIQGHTAATGDSIFFVGIGIPGSAITTGTYNSNTTSLFKFLGSFNTNDSLYTAYLLTPTVNTAVQVTAYSTTTRIIQGTFSGTAKNKSGAIVTITGGKFVAKLK